MMDTNKTCSTCRYATMSCPILPCSECSEQVAVSESKWEAYTRADFIRSLSDEDLAEYIADLIFNRYDNWTEEDNTANRDSILSMLQEPVAV